MILKSEITQLVPSNVKLGFYLLDTKTKEQIVINENDWFPLASVSKLITAIFALAKNINIKRENIFNVISKHCGSSYKRLLEEISSEEINRRLDLYNKIRSVAFYDATYVDVEEPSAIRIGTAYGTTDRILIRTVKQNYVLFTTNKASVLKAILA